MKQLYFLILTALICCSPKRQNKDVTNTDHIIIDNSIGVVTIGKVSQKDKVGIFNDDGTLWYEFSFDEARSIDMPPSFSPFLIDRDNLDLMFRCKETTRKEYIVFVNDHELKTLRKAETLFRFYPWEEFLLSGEVSVDPLQNPIYADVNVKSQIIVANTDYFNPVKIYEEWLQLEWREYGSNRLEKGWVKWRDNQKLVIRLVFF